MPAARKDPTICTKCRGENDRAADRKKVWCTKCHNAYAAEWAKKNKEKRRETLRKYYETHKDTVIAAWQEENKERVQEAGRQTYLKNREKAIARSKSRRERIREEDPEAYKASEKERMRQWRADNPEASKETSRRQHKTRYGIDTQYTLRKRIGNRLRDSFRKYARGKTDGTHWEKIVGYSGAELEARLRSTIPSGYTWDDFLDATLEIDHIRPISSFIFTGLDCPEIRECWALSNLQLLTHPANKSKGAKLTFRAPA
jgi:5-methylcytosine-specific restriction endonuclease McrA